MKHIVIVLLALVLVFANSCTLLNQAGEYARFVSSNFSIEEVKILEIGGVDVTKTNSKSDLNAGEMLTLAGRAFSGEMPTKLKVYIEVENTSNEIAAISGLEWKILMKGVEYANGIVDDRVELAPYATKVFQLKADVDLLKVLRSESLFNILKVVFNPDDQEQMKELGLELKIKPYYKSGLELKKYPGYISLKP